MNTPEHDKLRAVKDESQGIGAFLDWLASEGFTVCRFQNLTRHSDDLGDYTPSGYYPTREGTEKLLARYFNINLNKLETEKQVMLDELREANP